MTDLAPTECDSPHPARIHTRHDFARELTLLREQANLSIRQIATKVRVQGAHSTIGDWFAGQSLPSKSSEALLIKVLNACGVDDLEAVRQWRQALLRVRRAPGPRGPGPAPYRGLLSFQIEDADWFFGRDALTTHLIDRLNSLSAAGGGIQVVVGASGSGKSSLLRAGLIPALRAGRLSGTSDWTPLLFVPGVHPARELADRLAQLPGPAVETDAAPGRPSAPAGLLVVVDQFEEVFTTCVDEDEQRAFIAALTALATDRGRTLVVLGLRADFYAHALRHPQLLAALDHGQLTVGPMNAAELRAAIVEPAAKAKIDIEPGLTELLLREISPRGSHQAHETGVLPLLSHALYATWYHGQGKQLTIASYREAGGIDGAVAATASQVYDALTAPQRDLAKRLFLSLIQVTPDTADTRRRATTTELRAEYAGNVAEMEEVLDRFIAHRLITADRDRVEISHEALLNAWPTLRDWLATDRAGLIVGQQLHTDAMTWHREGRDPARLYRGTRRAAAQDWAREHLRDHTSLTSDFLEASTRYARRRARRMYQLVATLTALLLITCTAAGYAIQQRAVANAQRQRAVNERNQAISRLVAGRADKLRDIDTSLAMQLSLIAYRINPTVEARSSLLDSSVAPAATRLLGFTTAAQSVAFSPNKRLLAAGSLDHTVRIWDTSDPTRPPLLLGPALTGPTQALFSVAFAPDGRTLAAAGADAKVYLWDVSDPVRPVPRDPLSGPTSTIYSVAFSPDGHSLAAGSADASTRLWDVTDPTRPPAVLAGPTSTIHAVAFSPDGHTLAAGSADASTQLWDVTDPAHPVPRGAPLTGHTLKVLAVAFSPDGRTLATGSSDKTVRLWDVTNRERPVLHPTALTGPTSWINALEFSPDSKIIAVGSSDNTVTTWDLASGRRLSTLPHPAPVTGISFGSQGHTIATSSTDAAVRLWELSGPVLTGSTDAVFNVAFSPDRHTIVAASRDETIRLWNVSDLRRPVPLGPAITDASGGEPFAGTVALSPDGRTIAIGTRTGPVQLMDISVPEHPVSLGPSLTGPTKLIETVAFSPDGNILVAAGDDTKTYLWDLTDRGKPTPLATIGEPGGTALVFSVAFSPDGHYLAAASSDASARLWDITDPTRPRPLGQPLTGFTGYVYSVAFSPDGDTLAVSSADKTIRLWDVTDMARPVPLGPPLTGPTSYVYWVMFSPDGRTLAAAVTDGTVWLLNTANPRQPVVTATLTRPTNAMYTNVFSPDGLVLAGGGADTAIRLWDPDPARVAIWVCATAGTPVTQAEWRQYVPDIAYDPPC
jgi:WD40 repeat protein/transcriptional regulator with XRE-family HTH domain